MTSLNIKLPDDLHKKIERRAAAAGHATVSEYIEELVRADAEAEDWGAPDHLTFHNDRELEALLLQRMDDDTDVEATPQFWRDLENRLMRQSRRREND